MTRLLKTGEGWRIGWNQKADKYTGLVGSDDWAIELSEAELNDFCRLLLQLVDTMNQMQTELMDREKITCEAETDLLWLEVTGYPHAYSLRLILNCDRRCEGNWAEGIAPQLAEAVSRLKVF